MGFIFSILYIIKMKTTRFYTDLKSSTTSFNDFALIPIIIHSWDIFVLHRERLKKFCRKEIRYKNMFSRLISDATFYLNKQGKAFAGFFFSKTLLFFLSSQTPQTIATVYRLRVCQDFYLGEIDDYTSIIPVENCKKVVKTAKYKEGK